MIKLCKYIFDLYCFETNQSSNYNNHTDSDESVPLAAPNRHNNTEY